MIAKLSLPLILALASVAHAADPETVAGAPQVANDAHTATDKLVEKVESAEQQAGKAQKENDELKKDNVVLDAEKKEAETRATEKGKQVETVQQQADEGVKKAKADAQKAKDDAQKVKDDADNKEQVIKDVKQAVGAPTASGAPVDSPPGPQTTPTDSNPQQGSSSTPPTAKSTGFFSWLPNMPYVGAKARAASAAAAEAAKQTADDSINTSTKWFAGTREHLKSNKKKYGGAALAAGLTGLAWADGKILTENGEHVDRQLVGGDVVPAITVPEGEATHQAHLVKSGADTLAFVGALATTAVAALTLAL